MKHKTFELIEVKADGEPGHFTALASVFGNVDRVGDRVMPGAFTKTLKKWRESGDPIPVVLSHQWDNPHAFIGVADPRAVIEDEKGLLVQGKLDLENDVAKQVHKLMKNRVIKGWSFGYTVPDGGEEFKDGANELKELDLIEVGPTLQGANPEAATLEVKATLPPPEDGNTGNSNSALNVTGDPTGNLTPATSGMVTSRETFTVPEGFKLVPNTTTTSTGADWQSTEPIGGWQRDKAARNVGPAARAHLAGLIKYYREKPHPFTACVRDNTKRFGEEGAKRVCATLKDIMEGTTHWRDGGHHSDEPETKDATERDFEQELYDASGGDLEGLLEMHYAHMESNGDLAKSVEPDPIDDIRERLAENKEVSPPKTEVERPAAPAKADEISREDIENLWLETVIGRPRRR